MLSVEKSKGKVKPGYTKLLRKKRGFGTFGHRISSFLISILIN